MTIEELEAQIVQLNKQIDPLIHRRTIVHGKLTKLIEARDAASTFDLKWAINDMWNASKARNDALRKWATEHSMTSMSIWVPTGQASLQIMMIKGDPQTRIKVEKGVRELLPLLTPQRDDGFVYFSIFEHNLSEHHHWELAVHPTTLVARIIDSRSRSMRVYHAGSLTMMLDIIYERYWYE